MGYKGLKSTTVWNEERARGTNHPPVIVAKAVLADQGEYPMGLIVGEDSDGKVIAYAETADEVLAAGDGTAKTYTGTLANAPAEPGTVAVADDTETFSDDGLGVLTGSEGGTGTVNYTTGAVSVTFDAAVTNAEDILVDYSGKLVGVLDMIVDTTTADDGSSSAALVIVHGSYRKDVAKYSTSETAVTTAQMAALAEIGLWAE